MQRRERRPEFNEGAEGLLLGIVDRVLGRAGLLLGIFLATRFDGGSSGSVSSWQRGA